MFRFLGALFLSILVTLGVLAAILVPKGFALHRSAASCTEANVPLIVAHWDSAEITKRAAPEFLVPAVQEGLPAAFAQLSKLGKLRSLGKPEGGVVAADLRLAFTGNRVRVGINNQQPQPIWAEFVVGMADHGFLGRPAGGGQPGLGRYSLIVA